MNRTLLRLASAFLAAGALIASSGCGNSTSPAPATQEGHYEGDGHDHSTEDTGHFEGDGHDHGDEASQGHPTKGPHGGDLIELGNEEYHAELIHDETTHRVAVYLLDGPGKTPVAVPLDQISLQLFRDGQFTDYALTATPGQADAASQFAIIDATLCDTLCHEDEVRGRLHVTIDGKPYTGTIEHGTHDGHDTDGPGHEDHH